MAGLVVNQGRAIFLEAGVNKTAPQNLMLRLFKNNWTPAVGDDETDATEADFTGYAAVELEAADWGSATSASPSVITATAQQFTSSADQTLQTLYGWYLTQETSGKLVVAGRFSVAVEIDTNGQTFLVEPSLTLAVGS